MEANFEHFVKLALKVDVRVGLAQFVLSGDQVSVEILGTECHLKLIESGIRSNFGIHLKSLIKET